MFTLNKFILKLLKPVNKVLVDDHETPLLMFLNEMNLETCIKQKKYKAFTTNKENIFILTLKTLIDINIPLKRSNSFSKMSL
ncbi:uncharacterized protein T551_01901 [Pneumocystis jirovecii RU7]|uniref:Uncharacterized protein n=1 Tax=Pneumocystis jirovecii (strain RU7) TaxID=1408657 RepID=A0A0W4ZNK2_PNEJ7|nr:uncharacterized protein T551_01901 [Pneumocystis jirovecii RU7]KTW29957.1 hypothetical protein T551_01901 [Pneumocystis jirovecii RU7]